MRCTSLSFVLSIALIAPGVQAAPAMFGPTAPTAQQETKSAAGWSLFGLGKKQPAPTSSAPTSMRNAQAPSSTGESTWSTLLGKPLRTVLVGKPKAQPQKTDVLSLQTPTSGPTPKTCLVMAQISEAQGDLAGARGHLRKALALDPKNVKTLREIGHLEDRQGQLRLAEKMYRRALDAEPSSAAVLNDLAICCARQGRLQESATLLHRAVQVNPQKTLYRNNIAKVLVEMGQREAAMQQLAGTHSPAAANYNMGQLLLSRGETDNAVRCFQLAVQLDPQLAAATTALASLTPAGSERPDAVHVAAAPDRAPVDPSPVAGEAVGLPAVDDGITPLEGEPEQPEVDASAPVLLPPVQ